LIGKDDSGGGVEEVDVCIGRAEETVLVLLSLSYSDVDRILVGDGRPSSCSTYTVY